MSATYGNLVLNDGKWLLTELAPHVAIRLKHLFPRVPKWQRDSYVFPHDTAHCADLSWFLSRYPMRMTLDDQLSLEGGRSQFEQNQAALESILKPDYKAPAVIGLKEGQAVRHYQAQAIAITKARKALLLGDDVGLGKTYTALGLLLSPETLPAAVVVETHMPGQWFEKCAEFCDLTVHLIKGTKPYNLPKADMYVFKYSQLLGWIDTFADGFFTAVVYDEIQNLRTGGNSAKGVAAKALSDAATYRMGLSATPIYGLGHEIWNIFQFLDPDVLGSHQEFLREWCVDEKEVRDPEALGAFLREQNIFIRRTKKDVGQQMDPVNTIVEHVDYNRSTLKMVEDIARTLALKTQSGSFMERGRAGRELDLLMRQQTGVAKARHVAQYARIFLESNIPIVLAGWHRDVYEIWLEELAEFNPQMYTGSESPAQKKRSKEAFMSGESNLFILSLRSGAGLDGLQHRCSTALIGELDWSPFVHYQIVGRLDREGQKDPVTAIYLNTDDGSDPPVVELLGLKASQGYGITDPGTIQQRKRGDKTRIQALAAQCLRTTKKAA